MARVSSSVGGSGVTAYRKATAKVVNSTLVETDLLNSEITIPGNTLATTGVIQGKMWGDWKQNSGGAANGPVLKFKFGATTAFNFTPFLSLFTVSDSPTRFGWSLDVVIANQNAANAQTLTISGFISCNSSSGSTGTAQPVTTGEGVHGAVGGGGGPVTEYVQLYNTAAIDTSAGAAIVFSTTNASNNANYEVTLQGAEFSVY